MLIAIVSINKSFAIETESYKFSGNSFTLTSNAGTIACSGWSKYFNTSSTTSFSNLGNCSNPLTALQLNLAPNHTYRLSFFYDIDFTTLTSNWAIFQFDTRLTVSGNPFDNGCYNHFSSLQTTAGDREPVSCYGGVFTTSNSTTTLYSTYFMPTPAGFYPYTSTFSVDCLDCNFSPTASSTIINFPNTQLNGIYNIMFFFLIIFVIGGIIKFINRKY